MMSLIKIFLKVIKVDCPRVRDGYNMISKIRTLSAKQTPGAIYNSFCYSTRSLYMVLLFTVSVTKFVGIR